MPWLRPSPPFWRDPSAGVPLEQRFRRCEQRFPNRGEVDLPARRQRPSGRRFGAWYAPAVALAGAGFAHLAVRPASRPGVPRSTRARCARFRAAAGPFSSNDERTRPGPLNAGTPRRLRHASRPTRRRSSKVTCGCRSMRLIDEPGDEVGLPALRSLRVARCRCRGSRPRSSRRHTGCATDWGLVTRRGAERVRDHRIRRAVEVEHGRASRDRCRRVARDCHGAGDRNGGRAGGGTRDRTW